MITVDGDIIKVEYAPVARFMRDVSPIIRRQLEDKLSGKTEEDEIESACTDTISDLRKELEYILNNHSAHKLFHKEILDAFDKAVARL